MTYASGRALFEADSHIMELPGFLHRHAHAELRDRLPRIEDTASPVERGFPA